MRMSTAERAPRGRRCSLVLLVAALVLPLGCRQKPEESVQTTAPEPPPRPSDPFSREFAVPIEEAHGVAAWSAKPALRTDMVATFGGRVRNQGTVLFRTDSTAVRMDFSDGTLLVFDGERAWVSPSTSDFQRARFHLRAWPYLLAAAFKLRDHGVRLEDLGTVELGGQPYSAAKLTFLQGAGDSPDNWMIAYREPVTNRLAAMAFIDTYGKERAAVERDPEVIFFRDHVTVEGVMLPTTLAMHHWQEGGEVGDEIGTVTFSNPEFVTPEPGAFDRPDDSVEDPVVPSF